MFRVIHLLCSPSFVLRVLIFLILIPLCSHAASRYPFQNTKQTQQFERLTKEFRCLVCQNEALADSEAPLAQDLRQKIYLQVLAGKSDQDIQNYLVRRYGDFVLLKPPLTMETALLWAGPFVLLLVGFFVVFYITRRMK